MLLPALDAPSPRGVIQIGDRALSYGELADLARAHAAALLARGVSPGDHVAVWATPAPSTVVAVVANLLAGFATVPLNPGVGDAELAHVLRDASPRVVVGDAPPERVSPAPVVEVSLRVEGGPPRGLPEPDASAPALVLYTSGTTGAPKGAVLTHRNVASNLDALAAAWAWTPDDVLVHALPLFHVHGLVLGVLGPLRLGASLRLVPRFTPGALGDELSRGGTMLFGVPTMYHRLADECERSPSLARALSSARVLVSGSAALPAREHARLERATGRRVLERYGLTETLINTAVRLADPPLVGSVGRPLDGVSVALVDDQRQELQARDGTTVGEVAVRGPNVFSGYLHRPEATAAVLDREGWFYTGDLATRDPEGALRIVGRRATDLIKTGGFKVGAGEVEGALLEHPDVREAAVVGAPDDDLGEKLVAFVVRSDGSEVAAATLIDHVARTLAPHKRPRAVVFLDALPRNAMGKVLKAPLRGLAT